MFRSDFRNCWQTRAVWTEDDVCLIEFRGCPALRACPKWSCSERWPLYTTTVAIIWYFESLLLGIGHFMMVNPIAWQLPRTHWSWKCYINLPRVQTCRLRLPSFPGYGIFPVRTKVKQYGWDCLASPQRNRKEPYECYLKESNYNSEVSYTLLDSHQNLFRFFEHKVWMKIRTDRQRVVSTNLWKRWVLISSLVRVNRANIVVLSYSCQITMRWIPSMVKLVSFVLLSNVTVVPLLLCSSLDPPLTFPLPICSCPSPALVSELLDFVCRQTTAAMLIFCGWDGSSLKKI